AERVPAGARILVIGGTGLEHALGERGLQPVTGLADDPVAVVQGFDSAIDWSRLAEASYAVHAGLLWVASNADSTIPTSRGIAPGNGTLVAAVHAATGRHPIVAGKPELPMHREAVDRSGSKRPLVVGDRLDTDIEAANRAGVPALLLLTGVTDGCDAALAPVGQRPQFIGADLRALHREPATLAVTSGQAQAGRWRATVDAAGTAALGAQDEWPTDVNPADHVRGTSVGAVHDDHADAVRALCGAVWARCDAEPDLVVDLTDVAVTLRSLTPATVEP
ncbi:MAG TPA: HAD hydrolase-like protein, partial [Jiangellaceae bacterium]|nr:HAD hydrolase-like protein [Jiangellaceae bacterium]